ncbi:hypothetical protein MS53_0714 [Mycoplasmopsis synoviae 53]|uniref:Uncharacterized protein n=1 Tax=Mycoplasmopsis synoviae (strain 53) TaxID=262723 RepID=A4Q814_MYCS5|nr:hypothetical protein MS53_0714 [Mycoplasmopsis synoviae 53]
MNLGCGGRTRTCDLWVMSPTSCQLLYSAIYKLAGDEGFEPPRAVKPLLVFKTSPFSQTWVITLGGSNRIRTCSQPVMSRLL